MLSRRLAFAGGGLFLSVTGIDRNPVAEIVESVVIALSHRKSLVTFGQVFVAKWQEYLGRMRIGPETWFGRTGNHCMRVAVNHFLERVGVIVKTTNSSFREPFLSGLTGCRVATTGNGDIRRIKIIASFKVAGQLRAGSHFLTRMRIGNGEVDG